MKTLANTVLAFFFVPLLSVASDDDVPYLLATYAEGEAHCQGHPPKSAVKATITVEFQMWPPQNPVKASALSLARQETVPPNKQPVPTWRGTETLAHNKVQEFDHPTGRYKISAVYRPLADEQTQRNNTFYVTLNYRCGSNDVEKKFTIPKEYVTRLTANGVAYAHDVNN